MREECGDREFYAALKRFLRAHRDEENILQPRHWLWYLLYADDLVLLCPHFLLETALDCLFAVCEKYGLHVNVQKSGAIKLRKHCVKTASEVLYEKTL